MRVVVVTSQSLRHMYFAGRIAGAAEVVAVFAERKSFQPQKAYQTGEEKRVLDRWFSLRSQEEERFFGTTARRFMSSYQDRIHKLEPNEINDLHVVDRVRNLDPDAVTVFGSSLLKAPFIEAAKQRISNMHLGLSPHYRGSGTNFWPFYNGELEYVGVTVHGIDLGIDSGPIIHQGRPTIESGDNAHSIGNKAIITGAKLVAQTLMEMEAGTVTSHRQPTDIGRLYRRADFGPEHVRAVFKGIEDGMIEEYAAAPPPHVDLIR